LVENYNKREEEKTKDLVTHAYYTAAFQRAKKLPKLKELLNKLKPKKADSNRSDNKEELKEIAKKKGLTGPW
jgi:hypothetical protein